MERLIDADVQFVDDETNVEDMAIEAVMISKLKESLWLLSADELEMIHDEREKIKKNKQLKQKILIILNFENANYALPIDFLDDYIMTNSLSDIKALNISTIPLFF